jgi:subtilisin family serine protease
MTWVLSENLYSVIIEDDPQNPGILISKAKSKKDVHSAAMDKYVSTVEPYYNKQWALNNDGTFTLENSNYIDMMQNSNSYPQNNTEGTDNNNNVDTLPDNSDSFTIPDEFISIPDDFFTIPEDFFSTPEENITYPDEMYPWDNEMNNSNQNQFHDNYFWEIENIPWENFQSYHYSENRNNRGNAFSRPDNNTAFVKQLSQTTAIDDIDIDAKEAWEVVGNQGRKVIVAIIDTGFDYNHEDLQDVAWINKNEIPNDGIDNDNNGYVDDVYGWDFFSNKPYTISSSSSEYDHGTHIAGIIAANMNNIGVAGIIPNNNIKIMSIKALGGSSGYGSPEGIIQGIKYAEKMGASICNISFGTTDNVRGLQQVINESNMLFVCAAGNANSNQSTNADENPTYPAAYDFNNIISVANITFDGSIDASSYYGQYGVDIAAPGTAIFSTLSGNQYGYMSGTSMAAPMVTAVTAMTYSYFKNISLMKAKKIVLNSVNPLASLDGKVSTGGMLNAYNAVTYDITKLN